MYAAVIELVAVAIAPVTSESLAMLAGMSLSIRENPPITPAL
jgi:hypothetical protein